MIVPNTLEAYVTASRMLREGKLVIVPGVTNYSLAVHAELEDAIQRLYQTKQRPESKAITLLAPPQDADQYVDIPHDKKKGLLLLGDPIVLIAKAATNRHHVSRKINTAGATFGILWLNIPGWKVLYNTAGFPIVGSSLNISNEPSITRIADVVTRFGDKADLIIDGGDCPCPEKEPTVLDISGQRPKLVRDGYVTREFISYIFPEITS